MKIHSESRIPQKGDVVGAVGHQGTFAVIEVQEQGHTVDIQLLKSSHVERVTWNALKYVDELSLELHAQCIDRAVVLVASCFIDKRVQPDFRASREKETCSHRHLLLARS